MAIPLRVLILEDNPADAELVLHELQRAGFEPDWRRVDSEAEYLVEIERDLDLILADYSLPQFNARRALHLMQQLGRDIPFIVVTGSIGEEAPVQCMKQGASDYLIKDRLARLGPAVTAALEQKRLREEKRRADEALQKKNEEVRAMTEQLWQTAKLATMGELAASIAHELNNPLATVSLRVESLLTQVPQGDPKRRPLEVIEQEVERMGNLVTTLLDFGRRSRSHISTLDVREEIERSLELISYHLRNRRITVVREFPPEVPMIQADRQHLRQLFLNLFTNASDAMPQGGTLTIRVFQKAEGSEAGEGQSLALPSAACLLPSVVIEVVDTGVGIPPENLPRMTEPFFTTKPEGKGTGLGLPICRRIVQEHHGTLDIVSEVARGTTVRIVLPVANTANGVHLREA